MSVKTTYDEKRDVLREDLNKCLNQAREMLDEGIYGYTDMNPEYAMNLYQIIKIARDSV